MFGSSAHLLPPSGSVSFNALCKVEGTLSTALYCLLAPFLFFVFSPTPQLSPFLTSLSITYTKSFLFFFFLIPGSGNLELNGWQKMFWGTWETLTASPFALQLSSFSFGGVRRASHRGSRIWLSQGWGGLLPIQDCSGLLWTGSFRGNISTAAQLYLAQNFLHSESGHNNS